MKPTTKANTVRAGIVVIGALAFGYLTLQIGFKPFLEQARRDRDAAASQSQSVSSSSDSDHYFSDSNSPIQQQQQQQQGFFSSHRD